jgi:hypothetical protein
LRLSALSGPLDWTPSPPSCRLRMRAQIATERLLKRKDDLDER